MIRPKMLALILVFTAGALCYGQDPRLSHADNMAQLVSSMRATHPTRPPEDVLPPLVNDRDPAERDFSLVRIDRLDRLANYVAQIPAEKLDMGHWGNRLTTPDDGDDYDFKGCALGHATKLFAADGLKMEHGEPAFQGVVGCNAAQRFFGISFNEAARLFSGRGFPEPIPGDPLSVSRRIRAVANSYRVEVAKAERRRFCEVAQW